ncbi:alpha/beta hydrolase family protein [Granulicella tundricola]|uniref:alpha/beta hydrolase family protein n=1 Tax=Granulicella tundricola TaxID=940615 RepID=UPI0001DB7988|nr:prolyl oligopeptidase family serine peptidase [Granulicella tundricola]
MGDKTTWYAFYSGILYAKAGAVVVTYDPIGEDERVLTRASDARAHDIVIPGPQMPARLGGQMITDILQSTSYLAQRPDVDASRIAVLAYSMGSFHASIAGAIDPHIHALILSGGGNLDGPGGYWDSSPKLMCQAGPYHALEFLGDRGAILYALNANRGATLVMNGTADSLITSHHTEQPFFDDLHHRTELITGPNPNLFQQVWFPDAGHRPSFVTKPAALFLQRQLHFSNWTEASIEATPIITIHAWSDKTGAQVGAPFQKEASEWGVPALDADVPAIPRADLQTVPDALWQQHKDDYTWTSWSTHAQAAAQ